MWDESASSQSFLNKICTNLRLSQIDAVTVTSIDMNFTMSLTPKSEIWILQFICMPHTCYVLLFNSFALLCLYVRIAKMLESDCQIHSSTRIRSIWNPCVLGAFSSVFAITYFVFVCSKMVERIRELEYRWRKRRRHIIQKRRMDLT